MLLNDFPADGQAKAGSAFLTGISSIHLLKATEDDFEFVGGNAAPTVDNRQGHASGVGVSQDGDCGVFRRKLDGVRDEVRKDLEQPVGIGDDFHLVVVVDELNKGCIGDRRHVIDGLLNDLTQLNRSEGYASTPAPEAIEVENVVDQANQSVGVSDGYADQISCLFVDLNLTFER